ncbi:hypothetical protein GOP47_0002905 [Adiantum capillus-veneris]|uniref:Glycosyltransferase n=1 Tax=Adiantum capillus-veneris TaxID=13818 RepID=A0A9D4VBH7_ADICA|nr:hypothetical protein GOP47_0002905 [Adiantum capillus-veneris]
MPAENGALVQSSTGHASPPKHHAVVVPWPGQGHINPLLHLSRTLASKHGFSITFVNLDFTHRLLLKSLQKEALVEQAAQASPDTATAASAAPLDIKFVSIPCDIPAEASGTSDVPGLCATVVNSGPAFERLLRDLRPRPTCIISDIFVGHSQDAANKLGIPRVAFWTQSASCFDAHLAAARGLLPAEWEEGKLIDCIAGAPPLRFKDLPGFVQPYKEPDFMFNFCVQPFTRLQEAHCVLMNSFEAMEGKALQAIMQEMPGCRVYTVGPILPPDCFSGKKLSNSAFNRTPGFWAEDYSCLQWLDSQQEGSVLYVSFGSIALLTEEELHEFALGLEATGFPVLWVLRPGVLEDGGQMTLTPGFQDRTQGRMYIIDWAPQLHVLAHPSVGAFFTHAGWNSTLEGVSQGKPLLGFPYFADQMLNCRCIQDLWGNGLALERHGEGLLTRAIVETKSRTLMSDAKLRGTALLLRDGARQAILSTEQGSSTSDLQCFVEYLSLKSLK